MRPALAGVAMAVTLALTPAHAAPRLDRVVATPAVHEATAISVSKDGRYAAVAAYPTAPIVVAGIYGPNLSANVVLGPIVGPQPVQQVYVVDRVARTTVLVSAGKSGPGDNTSYGPSISADGRYLVFASRATNLMPSIYSPPPTNAYLYDRVTRKLSRVGVSWKGFEVKEGATDVAISADGSTVVFASGGAVLRDDAPGGTAVYARDRATGKVRAVTRRRNGKTARNYGAVSFRASRTGRYVAVAGPAFLGGEAGAEAYGGNVYVFDTKTGTARLVRGATYDDDRCPQAAGDANLCAYGVSDVAIDADGTQVAYVVTTSAFSAPVQVRAISVDLKSGQPTTLVALPGGTVDGLAYTPDGAAAYVTAPPHDSTATTGARVLYRITVKTHGAVAITALPQPAGCRTDGCVTYRLASVAPFATGVAFATDAPLATDDSDGLMDAYVATG